MFQKVLIVLALIIIVFLGIVAVQPPDFRITRSVAIAAPAADVFLHVNDFHKWEAWSPWAKLDPAAKSTFEGPSSGVGSVFGWDGNSDVGQGRQTIVESHLNERILINIEFMKPFQATNTVEFTFKSERDHTVVSWSMSGKNNFIGKAMSLLMNCDKMVGGQFEKGLANLKALAEKK